MGFLIRRLLALCLSAILLFIAFSHLLGHDDPYASQYQHSDLPINHPVKWKDVPVRYPVTSMKALPTGSPVPIPRIQHDFGVETEHNKIERKKRLEVVRKAFIRSWEGYKRHAWLQDEVAPITGGFKNEFGKRGATLVDALDTLLIMGLDKDFKDALVALKKIDFTTTEVLTLNVFETTIRYLGGFLSAYDISEGKHKILLDKAVELGDMLYVAFDTPNRLPITRWNWANGASEGDQQAPSIALSAELGSLSLEFTRLSQLTRNPKYYDAVQRISDQFERSQNSTSIPGLWPIRINPLQETFNGDGVFTFGGMSDSLYEYFPKQHMLLGGLVSQHKRLYEGAIDAAKEHLFFRPMNPENQDILLSGTASISVTDAVKLHPESQHLTCFAGGMVGIGARIFDRPDDLDVARKLVDGCIWAYDSMPTGIMPESFEVVPCHDKNECLWNDEKWHETIVKEKGFERSLNAEQIIQEDGLAPGFTEITDKRFLLRPEAIESIFILYRITGDPSLQDSAWRMFQSIINTTQTPIGNAAIADVTCSVYDDVELLDSCESFWMAETLKYFYLIFSEPDVINLDDWVLNTEAHPLRRPKSKI